MGALLQGEAKFLPRIASTIALYALLRPAISFRRYRKATGRTVAIFLIVGFLSGLKSTFAYKTKNLKRTNTDIIYNE